VFPSGCKSYPANSVAPAGSYRSGGGGNKAVGAFETNAPLGGAASRQAVTRVNAEQASKGSDVGADPLTGWGRPSSLANRETGGIGRPTSDLTQRSHRGNGNGMSTQGKHTQHGKPLMAEARDLQPAAREGQAGPGGVTDRPAVPTKPGNSGRGKGPEFKISVTKSMRAGRLA
jgi:hypothetical protein